MLHQEGAHEAALPEVDGVVGLYGDDIHRDASAFHVFKGLADLTTKKVKGPARMARQVSYGCSKQKRYMGLATWIPLSTNALICTLLVNRHSTT